MVEKELEHVSTQLFGTSGFDKFAFQHLIEDTAPLVVLKILARFYVSLQDAVLFIEKGVDEGDTLEIWKVCHKLTGSSELLGFKDFGNKSRRLDIELKSMPELDLHMEEINEYLIHIKFLGQKILESFPQLKNYL